MTTRTTPLLGSNPVPDNSGDVTIKLYSELDSGAVINPFVIVFNDSGNKDGIAGLLKVPGDYVGTAKVNIYWIADATTGDAVFDLSYLTRAVGEDMGAAATSTSDTVTTTTDGTAFNLNKSTMTLTSGDFAAGDIAPVKLFRNSGDASDDLAAPAGVFYVEFEYSDV